MSSNKHYKLTINKYDGNLNLVGELTKLIENKYADLFYAVIVHGSVATKEVVPYSDFDGLLIVKDISLTSKRLQRFKAESMKLILRFDPLQHHGWFQIKESQLKDYPQYYLPYEILLHSKLIFPPTEYIEVNLTINKDEIDYKRRLKQLTTSIQNQSNTDFKTVRLYVFKSFLSKVMLLPSMYYAAKYNHGIFKKDSFIVVRKDFNAEEWSCIETATFIRANWNYSLNPIQKQIMIHPERIFRRLTKKYIAPKFSNEINKELDKEFFKSLDLFIKRINKDIFAN